MPDTHLQLCLARPSDPGHPDLFLGIERGPLAGQQLAPTHQAFGQVCRLAATPSPASYFRESRLPAPIIADALNYNLRFTRDVEDVGVLATLGDEDNASASWEPRRSPSPTRQGALHAAGIRPSDITRRLGTGRASVYRALAA
jgi:hypothetical protein